ncbi:MAG: hypothetical protein ACRD38_13195 [Nitrososphaerales archaeon]
MGLRTRPEFAGISLAAVLLTAFVLVQPMHASYSVEAEGALDFQNCDDQFLVDVSMDTVRSGKVILTTHSEKEIFECFLIQGDIEVLVEVTIIAQIYENITTKDIIRKQVEVITCVRDPALAKIYACEVSVPENDIPPVLNCVPDEIRKNQNSINKGNTVKTIDAQKIVYLCDLDGFLRDNGQPIICESTAPNTDVDCFDPEKKIDEVVFTEIWKNLNNLPDDPIVKTTFESLTCAVKLDTAEVESCLFRSLGGS